MADFLYVNVSARHVATADNGDVTLILTTRLGNRIVSIDVVTISPEAWGALNSATDNEDMEF